MRKEKKNRIHAVKDLMKNQKKYIVNFKPSARQSKIGQSQNVRSMEHEIEALATEKKKKHQMTRSEEKGTKMLIANWVMNVTFHNMSCHLIYSKLKKKVFM